LCHSMFRDRSVGWAGFQSVIEPPVALRTDRADVFGVGIGIFGECASTGECRRHRHGAHFGEAVSAFPVVMNQE